MKQLILSLRVFKNYRLYSVINVLGLALSLACVIMISRYLYSETSVDTMHSKCRNIYAVYSQRLNSSEMNPTDTENVNNMPNFTDISKDPAVVAKTRLILCPEEAARYDNRDYSVDLLVVDSSFSKLFDFTTRVGSLSEVIRSVDQVALSSQMAQIMFGSEDPLGKSLTIRDKLYTVTAIMGEQSSKTSFRFDIIVPMQDRRSWSRMEAEYLLMADNFDYHAFNDKYSTYHKRHDGDVDNRFSIYPIRDSYFNTSISNWTPTMRSFGDKGSLNVIFIIAIVVLLIGAFNFINIYTVLMLRRSREVGVKKVFGATTSSITMGIYLENLLMVIVAVFVGWLITLLSSDYAASTLGIPVVDNSLFNLIITSVMVVIIPLLTTIYPYIKYRYSQPITSLRSVNSRGGSIFSRAFFLVLQYSMTIIMVIVSLYFMRQLHFMLNSELGYTHKDIISATMFVDNKANVSDNWEEYMKYMDDMSNRSKLLLDKLSQSPLIEKFSYNTSPIEIDKASGSQQLKLLPDGQSVNMSYLFCDANFFSMYDVEKLQGRLFSDSTDVFAQYLCIVNETLLRDLGIKDYTTALLQPNARLWFNDRESMKINPPYSIVGVIKDFHIGHLGQRNSPLIIVYNQCDNQSWVDLEAKLNIKVKPDKMAEAIELLGELHREYGNGEFSYTLLDDQIAAQYVEDRKVTNIFMTFAIIAILIGSLGLFSLSLYDVQQRYREIALRRINGATVSMIVVMLLRKYYMLLGISFVIGASVSYLAIDWYMSDFVTRAPLSWWIFALGAFLTAAISLLTLIIQTLRAARTNPAVAMKSE